MGRQPPLPRRMDEELNGAHPANGNGKGHVPAPDLGRGYTFGHNLTDMGNAARLTDLHGEDFRYSYEMGRFLYYDGRRWRPDANGSVERMAKDTVRSIYAEADRESDDGRRKALGKHAVRSESKRAMQAMMDLARSEPGVPVSPEDLDADPWLLNVENGTVDLRTGELRGHSREDRITKIAPVAYDPDERAPAWDALLERVLPSESLRSFLKKYVGYALTGDVSEQILAVLYGSGANGKSTIINAVLEMLGNYGKQAAPELLVATRGSHPTELADLQGARFVASVEVEDNRRMDESQVKQLTGGDKIKARYMRQDFFEFDPTHKVCLATNHKPVIRGTDNAIWRRMRLVPFDVTIPREEQDRKLPEKLRDEMPGILRWAVEGCLEWQREGLDPPEEVRKATGSYRSEMDVLAAFISDECFVEAGNPNVKVAVKEMYAAYERWCREQGEERETGRRFASKLSDRGFSKSRGTAGRIYWRGIGLSHPGEDDHA